MAAAKARSARGSAAAQSEPSADSDIEQQQNGGQGHNSTSASSGIEQSRQPPGQVTASAKNAGESIEHKGASRGEKGEASGHPDAAEPDGRAVEEAVARRESGSLASTSDGVAALGREEAVQGGCSMKAGGTAAVAPAEAGGGPAVPAAGVDHLGGKEDAQRRCDLFCALCTKKPQLLRKLLMVYGKVRSKP